MVLKRSRGHILISPESVKNIARFGHKISKSEQKETAKKHEAHEA